MEEMNAIADKVKHQCCLYVGLFCYAILQILYVFLKTPAIVVGDERIYKDLAAELAKGSLSGNFQYPLLYPLILAPAMAAGQRFYEMMLIINIVFKIVSLCIVFRLLLVILERREAAICSVLIGMSPIFFLYSRVLWAENLAAPLLVITVLYHIVFRGSQKFVLKTSGAALLSISLYWSKYLMIILMPILCLYWCGSYLFTDNNIKNRIKKFLLAGIWYTCTVLLALILYALVYGLMADQSMSWSLIKGTMGLSVASGPEVVGYKFIPQMKWIIIYFCYALLGICTILPAFIKMFSLKKVYANRGVYLFLGCIGLALIYIAARHSSLVDYNADGQMIKILGRYVAYITPLTIVAWFLGMSESESRNTVRKLLIAAGSGLIALGIPYLLLYKRLFWNPEADWLDGCRGLESIAFLYGKELTVLLFFIGIVVVAFAKEKVAYCIIAIFMLVNGIVAMFTWDNEFNYMTPYAREMRPFLNRNAGEEVTLLCNDFINYAKADQMIRFYSVDNMYDVWCIPICYTDGPVELPTDRKTYLMLYNIEEVKCEEESIDKFVFFEWDIDRFSGSEIPVNAKGEEDAVKLDYEYGEYIFVVYDNMVWPMRNDSGKIVLVNASAITDMNSICIYDLSVMQTMKCVQMEDE